MSFSYQSLLKDEKIINHTKNILSNQNSDVMTFYMHSERGLENIALYNNSDENNFIINSVGHSNEDQIFIRSIFNSLDKLIDLDFEEMSHNNGSILDIYSINYSSLFALNAVGQALPQESELGPWWDIFWKDVDGKNSLKNSDKNTIVHEIGHTLGLSHPNNDPFNESYKDKTIMSYLEGNNGWNDWFTNYDISALQSLWGREDDNGIININGKSNEYTFLKLGEFKYGIETEIGIEDITSIEKVRFTDKEININNDIIGVFNQIKGVNDTTGKIFRLYKSAFNRFPDRDGLAYWIKMNKSGENSFRQTAESFINSTEFLALFAKSPKDDEYLTSLYENVLDREPDIEGLSYWSNQLQSSNETRAEILIGFSESNENISYFNNVFNI